MIRIAAASAVIILLAVACSKATITPVDTLPEPVAVTADDVPDNGADVFYYVGVNATGDPTQVLLEAVRRGVVVEAAWVPQYATPCAAPTATGAMVVLASDRTGPLTALGFLSDPGGWLVNCGISDFWRYDFQTGGMGGQEFVFEMARVNYAWGRLIRGMYIDRLGRVYTYDHSQSDWHPKDPDAVTGLELREKFQYRQQVDRVSRVTLAQMQALIEPASRGAMSQPTTVCADFGGITYRGYLYNSRSDAYRPVDLYVAGDLAEKNLSDEAKTLYEWLFTVTEPRPQDCLP